MNLFNKSELPASNPELETIKTGWKGNPINSEGKFDNHEFPFNNDITRVIKWQFEKNPQKAEKNNDTFRLPVVDGSDFLKSTEDGLIWIGHATYLIRINGKLIITDPIFTVPSPMMKRFSALPIKPEYINNLDYILLSHEHYDHLNKESFKLIVKNNPQAKLLTGLKLGQYLRDWAPQNQIQEAGWYQKYNITSDGIEITFLPTRHWGTRGISGFNNKLWGAFMIQAAGKSIYFGGDSGYGSHFKEVFELFGAPDYAIIGIGAYKPEWFMAPSHTSPADALKAANDMKAKNFLPMHFGTFDLSDEPIGDPYREVNRIYKSNYSQVFKMTIPNIGEKIRF
ncbi:MAG: MBL fold metallo-hydrolase [Candidatus Kapabacteria bacterium]|nr:MBL fold metallo-hydrolase [Ignavibacteriota bacterium]MCW5885599.1 MBL fold metallo-hydrolase [Candidatus Kapabacteria bacterium]